MTAARFRTCAVCGRRVQLVGGGRPAVHTMGDHDDRICTGSGAPSYEEARQIWGMSPADRRAEERADDWSVGYRAGVIDAREGRPPRVHHGALTDAGTGYLAGYWRTRRQLLEQGAGR